MKTINNLFLTAIFALFTVVAMAQISGTKHDFRNATWNNGDSGEICDACHSPHQGADPQLAAPLWSRGTTITTFTAYSSPTFNADDTGTGSGGTGTAYTTQPSGVSLLCLTCHDGVQELDTTGGVATTMNDINSGAAVRNGGIDEHPISIDYTTELIAADGELHDAVTAGPRLSADGTVECSSCHDVHNSLNINGGVGLYAASNVASAMCLTCHDK